MAFQYVVLSSIVAFCFVVAPVYAQINTPCSASMITSFTPCLNFVTNSTGTGNTTPTSDCCNSLKSLTTSGTDCLCLIVTGSVPFQLPINRSLAISLPRACRMPGVPLQCKAAAAPVPPPGPATLGSAPSPSPSPAGSSTVPNALSPASSPESNTTPAITPPLAPDSDTTPNLSPPSTGVDSGVPTNNAGSRPSLTPSSAASTYAYAPFMLATSIIYFFI